MPMMSRSGSNRAPALPHLVALLLTLQLPFHALAQPAVLPFYDCFSGNQSVKLSVDTVYAQLIQQQLLNLTLVGSSANQVTGESNGSLATLFTEATTLTFNTYSNGTQFCQNVRPPSPLPTTLNGSAVNATTGYCPLPAGPFALSASIPFNTKNSLTTMNTQLRAVDPSGQEILCMAVNTTPLAPGPLGSPYGQAHIVFWATVGLTIAYWLLLGLARLTTAWGRGISRPGSSPWQRTRGAGFVLLSAISGERLAQSPALMRFCSPSMRDIIFHTQWAAALSMVAVQWPSFVYPLLSQTSWASLAYNITINSGNAVHWNALTVPQYNPPSNFADQFNDASSPIYINASIPNTLFLLPNNTPPGIESFAWSVGVDPQDLFGICLGLFLAIIAGTILISLVVWTIDWMAVKVFGLDNSPGLPTSKIGGARSPRFSTGSKDMLENMAAVGFAEEIHSTSSNYLLRSSPRSPYGRLYRLGRKFYPDVGSFHVTMLVGNLVRILVLFHLPITIFSSYTIALGSWDGADRSSVVLAALAFAVFSVLLPLLLEFRVYRTPTNKLYEETRTLLALGPLYNHYRPGSQLFSSLIFLTNLVMGVTIGAGQHSGTAQAIIILVVEVVSALVTSVWLPWGPGAGMGLISFLFCVARIVMAVLLVILTPTISIGTGAGGWVAYGILFVLCLVYLSFFLMLVVKVIEALVRIIGRAPFSASNHPMDTGLIGACGLAGCCGSRRQDRERRRYKATEIKHSNNGRGPYPDSSSGGYTPPNAAYAHKETASSRNMSGGPPSYLRPEHAMRPYKEESDDDENGHIMGAWNTFPALGTSGYERTQLHDSPPATPPVSKSGFARVGGGRAHFDSPYAIAGGTAAAGGDTATSKLAFPTAKQSKSLSEYTAPRFPHYEEEDLPTPTASMANVARVPALAGLGFSSPSPSPSGGSTGQGLPPGAMVPHHVRNKSQTAIIEDASVLSVGSEALSSTVQLPPAAGGAAGRAGGRGRHSLEATTDTGFSADTDEVQPRPQRRNWLGMAGKVIRGRRHSEGDALDNFAPPPPPVAQNRSQGAGSGGSGGKGRSFVVIRDRKPQSAQGPALALAERGQPKLSSSSSPSALAVAAEDAEQGEGRQSFVVLRGNNANP